MLEQTGIPTSGDILAATPSEERLAKGPVALFECFQNIPCNPCMDACPQGAITIGEDINQRPVLDETKCNGCGICLAHCPGLSIFVVDCSSPDGQALVKLPYEYVPLPEIGQTVNALNRQGETVSAAQIKKVQQNKNKTTVIWIAVPKELAMDVRGISIKEEGCHHG